MSRWQSLSGVTGARLTRLIDPSHCVGQVVFPYVPSTWYQHNFPGATLNFSHSGLQSSPFSSWLSVAGSGVSCLSVSKSPLRDLHAARCVPTLQGQEFSSPSHEYPEVSLPLILRGSISPTGEDKRSPHTPAAHEDPPSFKTGRKSPPPPECRFSTRPSEQ